ncbi:MAG: hypothetical protein V3S41_02425, partial [Spirochaetia bacterium]
MAADDKQGLTGIELEKAKALSVWVVWYQGKFGWGSGRDPASLVGSFLTEAGADSDISRLGGPSDSSSGKFDGYEATNHFLADFVP